MQSIEVAYELRDCTDYYIGFSLLKFPVLVLPMIECLFYISDGEVAEMVAAGLLHPLQKKFILEKWIQNDPWNAGTL